MSNRSTISESVTQTDTHDERVNPKGPTTPIRGLTSCERPRSCQAEALSFLYRLVRRVVEFVHIHRMDNVAKDAEILDRACERHSCRRQHGEGTVDYLDDRRWA